MSQRSPSRSANPQTTVPVIATLEQIVPSMGQISNSRPDNKMRIFKALAMNSSQYCDDVERAVVAWDATIGGLRRAVLEVQNTATRPPPAVMTPMYCPLPPGSVLTPSGHSIMGLYTRNTDLECWRDTSELDAGGDLGSRRPDGRAVLRESSHSPLPCVVASCEQYVADASNSCYVNRSGRSIAPGSSHSRHSIRDQRARSHLSDLWLSLAKVRGDVRNVNRFFAGLSTTRQVRVAVHVCSFTVSVEQNIARGSSPLLLTDVAAVLISRVTL